MILDFPQQSWSEIFEALDRAGIPKDFLAEREPPPRHDEPIELAVYDPAWPGQYAAEVERIAVSEVLIEHIGSTAVPDIALAKPVIDILIGAEREEWPDIREHLARLGYEDFDEAGVP